MMVDCILQRPETIAAWADAEERRIMVLDDEVAIFLQPWVDLAEMRIVPGMMVGKARNMSDVFQQLAASSVQLWTVRMAGSDTNSILWRFSVPSYRLSKI